MTELHFNRRDAEILYSIPKFPCDLLTIVKWFMFINRTAAPSRTELQDCLVKAISAGIVYNIDGRLAIHDKWYQDIHAAEISADNEIDAMLEFTDWFIEKRFHTVCETAFALDTSDYETMLNSIS